MRHSGLVVVLWGRLVCFACTSALLLSVIAVLVEIDGWRRYETTGEILQEIGARLILSVGCAAILGTAATLLALPFVLANRSLMDARCERIARLASSIVAIGFAVTVTGILVRWSMQTGLLELANRASIVLWLCLSAALIAAYLLYPVIVRRGPRVEHNFVDAFSGRATRRFLLIGLLGGLLTAFRENPGPQRARRTARPTPQQPKPPNVILVTFDALCAEDMSCYGYPLDTTPNIDALARNSHLFTNYYATSTFTTPNIVSMLSGRYPSSTHVYHYGGKLHGKEAERTLPRELGKAGYRISASVANPGAHPACLGFGADFDDLPPPPITDFITSATTATFHSAKLADDARLATRLVPYSLEQLSPRLFGQKRSDAPPELSFQQAQALLRKTAQPYFLWVHTMAPHFPYLPDPPYLHKFLAGDELRTHAEFANMVDLKGYGYTPSRQPVVDKARLRYNEWVAQADAAFGQFMATLRASGHLENTAVIVSADHGESFKGGYVGHGGSAQLRPILHVPLLIHLPGQTRGQVIADIADQTTLAPTILELTGSSRPDWMEGTSLCNLMQTGTGGRGSLAFAQYLESNNVFDPVRRGTVGVIDGQSQYVLTLDDGSGALYALAESDRQALDRSAREPVLAAQLRGEIVRKFPALFGGKV
jgi:arylsulfatase A-like enzyme